MKMPKLVEMDENITLSIQLEKETSPVIVIAKFNVNPADFDQFLKAWTGVLVRRIFFAECVFVYFLKSVMKILNPKN